MVHGAYESFLGLEAAAAYRKLILQFDAVSGVTVFQYDAPPRMQDRVALSEDDDKIVSESNRRRRGTGVPFWEGLFATCSVLDMCPESLLDATFFHNGQGDAQYMTRSEVEDGRIEVLTMGSQRTVAMGSLLIDDQSRNRHLNFLDLHCEVSPGCHRLALETCRRILPDGFLLLDSGGSYHACGLSLATKKDRIHILATALLASPIVDARYVAHQLLQDSSSIRISRGGKLGKVPVVVDVWVP